MKKKRTTFRMTKDYKMLRRLHRKGFPGCYIPAFKEGTMWEIRYGGEFAGFTGIRPHKGDPGHVFLFRTYVLPKFQGKGLHKKAVAHRLRYLRRNGAERVFTYVAPENFASLAVLIKGGLKLYESNWAGKEYLHLQKWL